jgi:adenine phosphoribosyltransferase
VIELDDSDEDDDLARVRDLVRDVPDFPSPGVLFRDITPVLADAAAFTAVATEMATWMGAADVVVGIEARGFILGAALALELGLGFVPVRKAGKLPGEVLEAEYELEYGSARIEVHADAFVSGARVLVIDDVLATGGTAEATCELLERAGATVEAFEAVIELGFLGGRAKLPGRNVHTILTL